MRVFHHQLYCVHHFILSNVAFTSRGVACDKEQVKLPRKYPIDADVNIDDTVQWINTCDAVK